MKPNHLLPIRFTLSQLRHQSNSSKSWLQRHVKDQYVKQASNQSLRSRSHFKLVEIQEKYKLIFPNDFVIDLGAAPGGWSLAVAKILNLSDSNKGLLIAVDLLSMESIPNVKIIKGDFTSSVVQDEIISYTNRYADVILSDMLQNTTGQHDVDHFRSLDLCRGAVMFCKLKLAPTGAFLCKYLRGSDEKEFIDWLRSIFESVQIIKPKSSRSESSEVYVLARKWKQTE